MSEAAAFPGAVVLQQLQNPVGSLPARTVIDGQQRLTTLQILIDALHGERLVSVHEYFASQAREGLWLNGAEDVTVRAEKLKHAVRERLQLVVIDLTEKRTPRRSSRRSMPAVITLPLQT